MSSQVVVKRITSLKPSHKLLIAVTIGVALIAIGLIVTLIVFASLATQTDTPLPTTAIPVVATAPPAPPTTPPAPPTTRPALVTTRPPLATPVVTTRPPLATPVVTTRPPQPTSIVVSGANPYVAQGCDDVGSLPPRLTCPPNKSISGGNIQYGQWNVADYGGVSCGSPNPTPNFVTAGLPAGAFGQTAYQLGPITSYSYNPNPNLPANGVSNQILVSYQCT